ncbi:hypothetical protein OESDEN_17834 [Oesophagostomum dentatum]|uniref:Uncharacterized protein n=1 Tax=Oesophagostomum dentatum TaxID=61180 RepID=A0A0B1SG09_OESDE|nr:hypothetical protein OESDEN_17834 [Oesophagostomum dentatum]
MLLDPTEDEHQDTRLISPCIPPDFEISDWEYALKRWNISGTRNYSFESCYDAARHFVISSNIMKLSSLRGKTIYLFSYYYDRGLNAGLIKENDGGAIKLLDYRKAAEKGCLHAVLEAAQWSPLDAMAMPRPDVHLYFTFCWIWVR